MSNPKSVTAIDLPKDKYPFTIRTFRTDNNEELEDERIEVTEPCVVKIEPLAEKYGVAVWVRIEYADGSVYEQGGSLDA